MTEDNAGDLTVAEAMEFAAGMADEEVESFDGDVPKHSGGLIVGRASDLLRTITNVKMAEAKENVEDPSEEAIAAAIEEDAVDVFLALGTLKHEYDIDLASAVEGRQELIEDYQQVEEAMEDAETQEDVMEAVDEHMSEELEELIGGAQPHGGGGALGNVEAGENVDDEDYDHDQTDKSFA